MSHSTKSAKSVDKTVRSNTSLSSLSSVNKLKKPASQKFSGRQNEVRMPAYVTHGALLEESGEYSVDKCADLRYSNLQIESKQTTEENYRGVDTSKWRRKSVLVKKRCMAVPALPRPPGKPGQLELPVRAVNTRPQVYSETTSMCKQTAEALQRQHTRRNLSLEKGVALQEKALQNWSKHKTIHRKQETHLSQILLRSPRNLALNRSFMLPPIESREVPYCDPDFPQTTEAERSVTFDRYYSNPEEPSRAMDLHLSYTWTERELYKTPVTIIRHDLDQDEDQDTPGQVLGSKQMRRSQALRGKYVRGKGLGRPRQPSTGDAGDACQTRHLYQGDVQLEPPKRPVTPQSVTFKPVTPESVTSQSDTPQPVTTLAPKRYNKPCLQVADRVFPWNEPCTLEVTEVGVKAEFGVLGKTSLKLVNLGCTVIRYSWQHQAHRDVFQTGRYRTSPFQFDCHDGVILPHDSAILALHFRSEVPGVWCEYWHLYTIPRLGPACRGNILVAFWGIALDIDRNRLARQGIDEELEQLAAERDIARCVQDLVACLPLEKQSDDQKEAEREVIQNTVPDDVRIFESQNPGLIYRSHAMQTLFEICRYQRRFSGFDSVKKKVGKHWTNVKGINKLQRLAVLMSAITSPITKNKKRRSSTVDHHGHSRSKPDRRQTKRLPDDPENIHMTRAGVKVKELRQNLRWVPESYDELMLKKLDNAVSEMSHPQTVALQIDWRSFVCKLGLSQALDAIAQAECKLLLSLCLLEESKAKSQRTTTGRDTTGAKDSRYGSSSSLLYLAVPGTIPCRTMSLGERPSGLQDIREVSQECLLTLSQECWVKRDAFGLPRFVDLSDELQAQYDTKLNDVVYSLLARMVETVFPSGGAMVDMMGRIIHPPE